MSPAPASCFPAQDITLLNFPYQLLSTLPWSMVKKQAGASRGQQPVHCSVIQNEDGVPRIASLPTTAITSLGLHNCPLRAGYPDSGHSWFPVGTMGKYNHLSKNGILVNICHCTIQYCLDRRIQRGSQIYTGMKTPIVKNWMLPPAKIRRNRGNNRINQVSRQGRKLLSGQHWYGSSRSRLRWGLQFC